MRVIRRSVLLSGGVFAAAFAACGPRGNCQAIDPQAKSLIASVVAAYRGLTTFSANFETVQVSGKNSQRIRTQLLIQKPGKVSATVHLPTGTTHLVATGATLYVESTQDPKRYFSQQTASLNDALMVLVRSGGAGVGLIVMLLTSPDASAQMIPGRLTSLRKLPPAALGGVECDRLEALTDMNGHATRVQFNFGKRDHLMRRISFGPALPNAPPEAVETYTSLSLHPAISAAAFRFSPAKGAVAVTAPTRPQMFDPRLRVGASPIPISGIDLAGLPVSLAQYRGKVLLIDFWATWCGPCVGELPNVVAAYNRYHAQGFEVLGVTLDEMDARERLRTFIAQQHMTWRQIYDGKGWQAANATAYGIRSIPFTLLVGRDGKIAAVGARGSLLGPAIETALAKR